MRDVGEAHLTWRRLGSLIAHLPADSETSRSVGGERTRWGHEEHLLAALVDEVAGTNYLLAKAHFKGQPKPPKPIPRPGDATARPRHARSSLTPEQTHQRLLAQRQRLGKG